jgi:hypothetical protein
MLKETSSPPFRAGSEKPPQPTSRELLKKKTDLLEKVKQSPWAVALAAVMAIQNEAGCAPFHELAPHAADIGKTDRDVDQRMEACRDNGREAENILKTSTEPTAILQADVALFNFSACRVQLEHGIWSEQTFIDAQTALDRARAAHKASGKRR